MKKSKLTVAILLVVCLVAVFTLAACKKTNYTVTWQNGKNYSFTDESGQALTGEQKVAEGTVLKFKVVPANTLTTVTKVTAGDEELTADNGVYSVTVTADVKIAALATTLNNDVQSIAITTQPTKTTYNVGDTFNRGGMVVTATLRDGTTTPVTTYSVIYQNGSAFVAGDTKVTISYTDSFNVTKTADVAVTVNNVTLTSISVSGSLTKTEYVEGSTLDSIAGVTVTAHYSDESTPDLSFEDLTVVYQTADATSFTLGDTKVTLKYGDQTVDLDGITVRAWQAFNESSISAEMKTDENGKPVLEITGTVIDATQVAFVFSRAGVPVVSTTQATLNGKNFTVVVDLTTALANGVAGVDNDCKLYYDTEGGYKDVEFDSCTNKTEQLFYHGAEYHFAQWEGKLKVNFTNYELREVAAELAPAPLDETPTAINLTVMGELGTASSLALKLDNITVAMAELDTNDYTFEATVELVAFVVVNAAGVEFNHNYIVKIGDHEITADEANLTETITLTIGDYVYTASNDAGKLALKVTQASAEWDTEATIAINQTSGAPELTIIGKTAAEEVTVRIGSIEEEALVDEGGYLAVIDLKELFLIGKAYNVEISEDGGAYAALTMSDVDSNGSAEYTLTAKPNDYTTAKNLYSFVNNDGKLAVSYTQSAYKGNEVISKVCAIDVIDGQFVFTYDYSVGGNHWGLVQRWDKWLGEPSGDGSIKVRTLTIQSGTRLFEYQTDSSGTVGPEDEHKYLNVVYDGSLTGFVAIEGIVGFEIINGRIHVSKIIADYTAVVNLQQFGNGEVVLTVSGQFDPALADTTGYGVHAWYGAGIDFNGSINADGTFTYEYSFGITGTNFNAKVGTMYLHMMNAGDEVNLKGTISGGEDTKSQTFEGYVITINRNSDSGVITVVVTAAE